MATPVISQYVIDMNFILKRLIYAFFCSAAVAAGVLILFSDVFLLKNAVGEDSITEIVQELLLLLMVCLFAYQAWRYPNKRRAMVLIAGFFACMLIREMDFAFDELRHGSWLYAALAVTLGCGIYALRAPQQMLSALGQYFRHPSYGMMLAGLLCILIFSRLFGMGILWKELMLNDYSRVVKNMVEEGNELFGYIICFLATLWYSATPTADSGTRN